MNTITIQLDSHTAEYLISLLADKAESMESLYRFTFEKLKEANKELEEKEGKE